MIKITLEDITKEQHGYGQLVKVRSSLLFPQVGVWRGLLVFNNNLLVN
jgi:hypothetical protein